MTPRQIRCVQETFQQVMPHAERVADRFYDRLFALDPSLRALFHHDMDGQGKKLMATLALVAYHLDRPEEIVPALRRLGQRHVGYGVQPEDYEQVGEALLWALSRELGEAFTEEVEVAWGAAYSLMAGIMQEGAAAFAPASGLSC